MELVVFFAFTKCHCEGIHLIVTAERKHVPIFIYHNTPCSQENNRDGKGKMGQSAQQSERDPISRRRRQSMVRTRNKLEEIFSGAKKSPDNAQDAIRTAVWVININGINQKQLFIASDAATRAAGRWVTKGTFYSSCCVSFGARRPIIERLIGVCRWSANPIQLLISRDKSQTDALV